MFLNTPRGYAMLSSAVCNLTNEFIQKSIWWKGYSLQSLGSHLKYFKDEFIQKSI